MVEKNYESLEYSAWLLPSNNNKLVLLASQQASNSRGEVLGQGIATLFRKPTGREVAD